jgi:large subunit ribosomal protein L30
VSAAKGSSAPSAPTGHLKVTQVRSAISTKPKHRGTLRALGLRGVGRSRVLPDRPDVRGMLARVPHLVLVAPATEPEAVLQHERSEAARRARRTARGDAGAVSTSSEREPRGTTAGAATPSGPARKAGTSSAAKRATATGTKATPSAPDPDEESS